MPKPIAGAVLSRLSVLTPLTDGQLLDRVVSSGDEAAFECLVWRHGPMVLGVCRRGVGNDADADDAFQATFLVLFQRAATVRPAERVGAWLHGVAVRAAAKVRTARAKRAVREADAARPEAVPPAETNHLAEALDAEIARLPEKYRIPVVLCDLQGEPIRETAERLGWPQGTLASRLARGRELLARRLRTAGWGDEPVPAAAPALTAAHVQAVQAALAGSAGPAQAVAASVLHSLWMAKMKNVLVGATVALVFLVGVGYGVATALLAPGEAATSAPVPEPAVPRPDELIDGRWRVVREERGGQVVEKPEVGSILFQRDMAEFISPAANVLWSLGLHTARPATGPRHVDVTAQVGGEVVPCQGIYERTGNRLRVCFAVVTDAPLPPKHDRPTEFKTAAGGTAVLWDLVRDPVAWGPPRGGLRLGVAYPAGQGDTVRAGDRFRVDVFLKNVTDAPIDYDHLDRPGGEVLFQSVWSPWITDAEKTVGKAYVLRSTLVPRPGDAGTTKKTLAAGAVVRVGSPTFSILPAAKDTVGLEHRPGRYHLSYSGVTLDGVARAEGFTAGPLPLVVARPEVKAEALPDLVDPRDFRAEPYLRAAVALQAMKKDEAVDQLKAIAAADKDGLKTAVLCRLLFVARPGKELRLPVLGGTIYLGRTGTGDWPLAPVAVVDGVPFLVLRGRQIGGLDGSPEAATAYLDHCLEVGDWSGTAFFPKTDAERKAALEKLLADPRLKDKLSPGERTLLAGQIDPPGGADLGKLQGHWRLVGEQQGGKPVARPAPTGMLILADTCRTYLPDGTFREDEIRLDPAARPKAIDFRPRTPGGLGEPVPAIYDLDGDRLRLCIQAETNPNTPRPAEFAARATAHFREYVREPIAWGNPVEGLRLGVAVSPAAPRVGESVTVRLYATNASAEAITFESPALDFHYPFCQPVFFVPGYPRAKLWFVPVPGIRPPLRHTRYAIGPQGVVELGSAKLALCGPDAPNVPEATVVLEPGTYIVRFEKFETKGKPKADTGVATLSVGQP